MFKLLEFRSANGNKIDRWVPIGQRSFVKNNRWIPIGYVAIEKKKPPPLNSDTAVCITPAEIRTPRKQCSMYVVLCFVVLWSRDQKSIDRPCTTHSFTAVLVFSHRVFESAENQHSWLRSTAFLSPALWSRSSYATSRVEPCLPYLTFQQSYLISHTQHISPTFVPENIKTFINSSLFHM